MFYGIVREHHTRLQSDDERFKSQRKWLQDLMSQKFLHGVAGPHLHKTFMELVGLWQEKLRLSGPGSQAFSAKHDVTHSALEAIWAAMFGTGGTTTITMKQTNLLSSLTPGSIKRYNNGALDFPEADRPTAFDTILRLTDTFETVCKSPFPLITGCKLHLILTLGRPEKHHADSSILGFLPYRFSNLVKAKNSVIINEIRKAEQRPRDIKGEQGRIFNAVDHMLHREAQQADKEARGPEYYSKAMIAEVKKNQREVVPRAHHAQIFGFLIAGHETTSQTIMWILKILSDHPAVQSKLRTELRNTYSAAMADGRVPTAKEVATMPIQYLDACIEEFMRWRTAGPMTSRTSTTDAVILGHVVPKGTRIMMMSSGGGVLTPAHKIPDSIRSPAYQSAGGGKIGSWDESIPEDMAAFNPDRWLKTEVDGSKVFDATLGPQMGFGAGPRGCFGRKLAYLEVRLAIVLLLWHFELQKVPEPLNSYEAIEVLTHGPVHCYVRLSAAL